MYYYHQKKDLLAHIKETKISNELELTKRFFLKNQNIVLDNQFINNYIT